MGLISRVSSRTYREIVSKMQASRRVAKIFKYPTYAGEREGQASIKTLVQRLKKGIPNYYARSPGHFSKLRGILTHGARMSEFRCGELVGEDKYGNRYFEKQRLHPRTKP